MGRGAGAIPFRHESVKDARRSRRTPCSRMRSKAPDQVVVVSPHGIDRAPKPALRELAQSLPGGAPERTVGWMRKNGTSGARLPRDYPWSGAKIPNGGLLRTGKGEQHRRWGASVGHLELRGSGGKSVWRHPAIGETSVQGVLALGPGSRREGMRAVVNHTRPAPERRSAVESTCKAQESTRGDREPLEQWRGASSRPDQATPDFSL
jgi:hypothetical protein